MKYELVPMTIFKLHTHTQSQEPPRRNFSHERVNIRGEWPRDVTQWVINYPWRHIHRWCHATYNSANPSAPADGSSFRASEETSDRTLHALISRLHNLDNTKCSGEGARVYCRVVYMRPYRVVYKRLVSVTRNIEWTQHWCETSKLKSWVRLPPSAWCFWSGDEIWSDGN